MFVSIRGRITAVYEVVPAEFDVPDGLEHERFRLRMLTVDDVVRDFDAICARVDHAGAPQPPFVETVAHNLVDLGWHQKEFELRRSFAYTVVAPDESRVLGCFYLYPDDEADARAHLWVRRDAWQAGLDPLLEAEVRAWLERDWPFTDVRWPGRE